MAARPKSKRRIRQDRVVELCLADTDSEFDELSLSDFSEEERTSGSGSEESAPDGDSHGVGDNMTDRPNYVDDDLMMGAGEGAHVQPSASGSVNDSESNDDDDESTFNFR